MREITHEELKQIQLGILDKVHDFCEKNGITYFLSSGTLIGAVRHKGYIPWDDDLDLYMPRADYDKFIKLFSANPPENTRVLSIETNKRYLYSFAKVVDSRTALVEISFCKDLEIGVYIDIFPLENVPSGVVAFSLWYLLCVFLKKCASVLFIIQFNCGRRTQKEGFQLVRIILYPIAKICSFRIFLRIYNALAKSCRKGRYVYNMSGGIGFQGCFRRSAISKSIDIEFEGKTYKTMRGFREYLFVTYGDFMELPPLQKRVSNHSFIAWWKD